MRSFAMNRLTIRDVWQTIGRTTLERRCLVTVAVRIFAFLLAAVIVPEAIRAQKSAISCWYSDADGFSEHGDCLDSLGKGLLRVKPVHLGRLRFSGALAAVFNDRHGWMYVNRKGEVAIEGVVSVDNGPDEFSEGFVRYERNQKCGYAKPGEPGILPQFDGCMPFREGKARVCNGCRREPVDPGGESHELKGGNWYCIDRKGERVGC